MPLIPEYLLFLTFVLVVLPSFAAICLRLTLYHHLVSLEKPVSRLVTGKSPGKKPKILESLEIDFQKARKNLDRVNTAALVDRVYSHEKIWFISCDQIDYFCRLLPNLLLAFGLMGTFLGITLNLWSLSQTLSRLEQANPNDISTVLNQLQEPLQGMGIAFFTSLMGLFFSALITFINFLFNTSLAKYRLISYLEDYLDNIYQSDIPGYTPIDKAVDRMGSRFDYFLTEFGKTVRSAVEDSLKAKLQEIYDANIQATKLAEQVYSRFLESSTTIARSADEFKLAANKFTEASQVFENSQFAQILLNATENMDGVQRKFSESASTLADSVAYIEIAVNELQRSGRELLNLGEKIDFTSKTSAQVLNSYQSSQSSLIEAISKLQKGMQIFHSLITIIELLQQKIDEKSDDLSEVQVQLMQLVSTLRSYTEGVSLGIESLGDRLAETLDNQSNANNNQSQLIVENIQQSIKHLNDTKHEVYRLRQMLEKKLSKDFLDESKLDEIVDKLNRI